MDTHFALGRLLTSTDTNGKKLALPMISKKRLKKVCNSYVDIISSQSTAIT